MKEVNKSLRFLDALRGLAALYVMIGHARWLLWEGFESYSQHANQYNVANKLIVYFLSVFRYGHQAVLFFFVLSGFVIHLRYARQLSKAIKIPVNSFDFLPYLSRRIKRIFPPFLLAIVLTWLFDSIGNGFGFGIYVGNTSYPIINQNIVVNHEFSTLLGNLFFLMDTYVPSFGTNRPLWSLKYEWWFYMIYPLLWLLSSKNSVLPLLFVLILFLLSFVPGLWPILLLDQIAAYLLSWWLGAMIADAFVGRGIFRMNYFSLLLIFLPLGFWEGVEHPVAKDMCTALGFCGIIACCFYLKDRNPLLIDLLARLSPLGNFSYTLYVIHFPLLVLISGYLNHTYGQLPQHFGYVLGGSLASLFISWILHYIVERPFLSKSIVEKKIE